MGYSMQRTDMYKPSDRVLLRDGRIATLLLLYAPSRRGVPALWRLRIDGEIGDRHRYEDAFEAAA